MKRIQVAGERVGVAHWVKQGDITSKISRALEYLGCEVVDFPFNGRLPPDLAVVFAVGPFDSLVPLAQQLIRYPVHRRPAFVYMITEQFPNPELPEWFRYHGGRLRSRIERMVLQEGADGQWAPRPGFEWFTKKAKRFLYYGDLHWLQEQGILSLLVTRSRWTAAFLRARKFEPILLPPVAQGRDLQLVRDIPVLWIGKTGSPRRQRLLQRLHADLRERGVELLMIDGIENPYVFGEERTILLNRTRIVVNLLREKWDDNSMRYNLAASCRALIVTEPTLPHTFFEPTIHLVEVRPEQMAETICYYLEHEEERKRIADQGYRLITQQSGLELLQQVLERALTVWHRTQASSPVEPLTSQGQSLVEPNDS